MADAVDMLIEKVVGLESAVSKMADSINRLAVMEERQMADRKAMDRAFAEIENLRKTVQEHDKQLVLTTRTSNWVERGAWAVVCAVAVFIAKGGALK